MGSLIIPRHIYRGSKPILLGLILSLFAAFTAQAQFRQQEIGIPPHRDFTPADYKANGQNFSVLMDKRGIIYIANFAGVLEYDGTKWRTILTEHISKVNTLAQDSIGTIYVGARGELGYLLPDSIGNMKFASLMPHLDSQQIVFPDVLKCFAAKEGVYFITAHYILLWNGKSFTATKTTSPALNAFYVNQKLYIMLKAGGLQYFADNQFFKVPGGTYFSDLTQVNALLPLEGDKLLAGSSNQGLFILSKEGISPFKTEADEYLIKNKISGGIKLEQAEYAFGTAEGGVLIIGDNGRIHQLFNKQLSGLFDNKTNSLFQDRDGNLWVTLNRGITRIDLRAALLYFDEKKNVAGNVNGIERYQNVLYITTDEGFFYYDKATALFKQIPDITSACWDLVASGNELLVATTNGVYAYNGQKARLLMPGYALTVYPSQLTANIVYVGLVNGLAVMEYRNGQYIYKGILDTIKADIVAITEDQERNLWAEVPGRGILKLPDGGAAKSELYTVAKGLPNNAGNHLNQASGQVWVGTAAGVYQYNKQTDSFQKYDFSQVDTTLNHNWIDKIVEDQRKNIWITAGDQTNLSLYRHKGNTYKKDITLLPVQNLQIFKIYPEPDGTVWLGSTDKLVAFNIHTQAAFTRTYTTLIRSIIVNNDTLFRGAGLFSGGQFSSTGSVKEKRYFSSKQNNLRFEFSTPRSVEEELRFQYYLQGHDTDTIANWVPEREKEYSNLAPGNYVFHVKSKDIYGVESQEATFAFFIAKPLYLSVWAYLLYAVLFVAIVLLFVRLRSQQLLKEKKKLEDLIQERTEEVLIQKEEIEKQSLELSTKNDELERINQIVKSINAEINFDHLMQSILEKTRIIRGAEKAVMLVFDKSVQLFQFRASYGYATDALENIQLTPEEAESRYLANAEEIFEDIFFVKSIKNPAKDAAGNKVIKAKSALIMCIKLNQRTQAFLILENWQKQNAFSQRDFNLLKNLKEHFISAYIKTTLLEDIQNTLKNLKDTQEQLIRQEKLASIGQLTKGIVDRILNPLNYINNFSLISRNLIKESQELINELNGVVKEKEDLEDILHTVEVNLQKVNEHGASASRIVKGMEKILREKSTQFIETDINKLIETNVQVALQESKKEFPGNDIKITLQLDDKHEKIRVLPSEMSTVLINLLNNACFSVMEKHKAGNGSIPEVEVKSVFTTEAVHISIRDNGKGIPAKELTQLFAPFFTTKPTAKGTGLGLYLSQDIVKEHRGVIEVDTKEGEFTTFTIKIPKRVNTLVG